VNVNGVPGLRQCDVLFTKFDSLNKLLVLG
jgi:hypothetical protein